MTSLPRRLPQRGPVKERFARHHEDSRRAVMIRANGRCEAEDCSNPAEEWAHLFGRRHLLAEPWCSSPACTMGLCCGCHQSIDRGLDLDLQDRLRWVALVRLCKAENIPISLLSAQDILGAIRAVEDVLRARIAE